MVSIVTSWLFAGDLVEKILELHLTANGMNERTRKPRTRLPNSGMAPAETYNATQTPVIFSAYSIERGDTRESMVTSTSSFPRKRTLGSSLDVWKTTRLALSEGLNSP